jgi:hypothetical protein
MRGGSLGLLLVFGSLLVRVEFHSQRPSEVVAGSIESCVLLLGHEVAGREYMAISPSDPFLSQLWG